MTSNAWSQTRLADFTQKKSRAQCDGGQHGAEAIELRRIREELRRMGIRVSEPTIVRILRDHGFSPRPGRKVCFDRVQAAAKDTLWALDFS